MKVFCNGFPKSGNHALAKALELLGIPAEVNHEPFPSERPNGAQHILIKRDPRDIVVSWLRFNRQPVTPGTFIAAFRKFQQRSLVEEMMQFEGWLERAFVVPYESLIRAPALMQAMAKQLGTYYIDGAWENLPNHTSTWNAVRSDYREVWTSQVRETWSAEGGNELLMRWGY